METIYELKYNNKIVGNITKSDCGCLKSSPCDLDEYDEFIKIINNMNNGDREITHTYKTCKGKITHKYQIRRL